MEFKVGDIVEIYPKRWQGIRGIPRGEVVAVLAAGEIQVKMHEAMFTDKGDEYTPIGFVWNLPAHDWRLVNRKNFVCRQLL